MLLTALLAAALLSLAVYVHRTCMKALGPNAEDNSVRTYAPAGSSAAAATPALSLSPSPSPGPDSATEQESPLQPPVLAVVLGWGGSTTKQLRRLVAHFTGTLGSPVVQYINVSGEPHD
jgi:hypothetical protein